MSIRILILSFLCFAASTDLLAVTFTAGSVGGQRGGTVVVPVSIVSCLYRKSPFRLAWSESLTFAKDCVAKMRATSSSIVLFMVSPFSDMQVTNDWLGVDILQDGVE